MTPPGRFTLSTLAILLAFLSAGPALAGKVDHDEPINSGTTAKVVATVGVVGAKVGVNAIARKKIKKRKGTFAFEMEFGNKKIENAVWGDNDQLHDLTIELVDGWGAYMKELCAERKALKKGMGCKVYSETRQYPRGGYWDDATIYKVKFDNGFSYEVDFDEKAIELRTREMTIGQAKEWKQTMQEDMFDIAKKFRVRPLITETHLHAGLVSNFGNDVELLRDYLVLKANHQEFVHLFADDLSNAAPLSSLPSPDLVDRFDRFAIAIEDVDKGKILTKEELVRRIRTEVYDQTLMTDLWEGEGRDISQKFQQTNLERIWRKKKKKIRTVENRDVPNPQSADDVVDWISMEDKNIEILQERRRLGQRIILKKFNPNAPKSLMVANFKRYVEEGGEDWEKFRRFLKPEFDISSVPDLPPTEFTGSAVTRNKCMQRRLAKVLKRYFE